MIRILIRKEIIKEIQLIIYSPIYSKIKKQKTLESNKQIIANNPAINHLERNR
jgi:hypothetical protein